MTQYTLVLTFQGRLLLPSSGQNKKLHSKFMSSYEEEGAGMGAVNKPWALVAVKDGPLLLPFLCIVIPSLCGINSYLKFGGNQLL